MKVNRRVIRNEAELNNYLMKCIKVQRQAEVSMD